jgi:hypothetical protein
MTSPVKSKSETLCSKADKCNNFLCEFNHKAGFCQLIGGGHICLDAYSCSFRGQHITRFTNGNVDYEALTTLCDESTCQGPCHRRNCVKREKPLSEEYIGSLLTGLTSKDKKKLDDFIEFSCGGIIIRRRVAGTLVEDISKGFSDMSFKNDCSIPEKKGSQGDEEKVYTCSKLEKCNYGNCSKKHEYLLPGSNNKKQLMHVCPEFCYSLENERGSFGSSYNRGCQNGLTCQFRGRHRIDIVAGGINYVITTSLCEPRSCNHNHETKILCLYRCCKKRGSDLTVDILRNVIKEKLTDLKKSIKNSKVYNYNGISIVSLEKEEALLNCV